MTVCGTILDAGSGVDVSTPIYTTTDEYGLVQPTGSVHLGLGGEYSFQVFLQASRKGSDSDGRHYTIKVSAKDKVGNFAFGSTTITVPHDVGKQAR